MDRAPRSRFRFLSLLIPGLLLFSSMSAAAADPKPLEAILQKIESRHYRWVAIRAEVLLFFAVSGDSRAMCGGELLYQRLDERMFLPCVDPKKNLVFVFRTLDRRFDLYLPGKNTLYHGSIFDMEDSPDIESHLKPRDLYRALKPSAFDPDHTEIERSGPMNITLNVYNEKRGKKSLEKKLYLAPAGDVLGEVYYGPEGQPLTQIQRYDFREVPAEVSSFHSIIFPKKITIISPATQKGSALFFANVKALDTVDPLEFLFQVPPGTKEVFLDEKNSQLAMRQLRLGDKPLKDRAVEAKSEGTETAPEANADADADIASEGSPSDQVPEPEGPIVQYPGEPGPREDALKKE